MKSKKNKITMIFSCLFLSTILFVANIQAASVSRINPVNPQIQQRSLWCWAATASMAGMYAGASAATQTNIVTFIKGSPTVDGTGNVYDIQRALANYSVKSSPFTEPLVFSSIKSSIDKNQTVVAMVRKSTGEGHAYLINGYDEDTINKTQTIWFIDPATARQRYLSYKAFVSNDSETWVNTVTSIYK